MIDRERYRGLFVQEAREHLAEMHAGLDRLSEGFDPDAVDLLFRAAHSLKGMAATLGHTAVAELAHAIEDHLDAARSAAVLGAGDHEAIVQGVDRLADAVDAEEAGAPMPDLDDDIGALRARLDEAVQGIEEPVRPAADLAEAVAALPVAERRIVTARIAPECLAPKARLMVLRRTVAAAARIVAFSPAEAEWQDVRPGADVVLVAAGDIAPERLQGLVAHIPDLDDTQVRDHLPVPEHRPTAPAPPVAPPADRGAPSPVLSPPRTVRLALDDVDRLLDQAAELRIAHARLERQLAGHFVGRRPYPLVEAMQHLDREAKAIHDTALEMRTLPVRLVTDRLPRLVRDLAGRLGKQIRLEVQGSDTQADRSILETLADPLIHLVKNALDHGFEPPEERLAAGKPAVGALIVSFQRTANGIQVAVRDDGRGIPRAAALKKAVSAGLIGPDAADALSDEALFRLLSTPGFTTADEVTEISGRGVGLDAAKASVERVGGVLRLTSHAGEGTQVTLDLPPTLAVMEALEIVVEGEPYYIPIEAIVTTLAVDAAARSRGLVDVVDPRRAADVDDGAAMPSSETGPAVEAAAGAEAAEAPESASVPVRLVDLTEVLDLPPRRYGAVTDGKEEKVERLKQRLRRAAADEDGTTNDDDSVGRPHVTLGVVVERNHEQVCLLVEGPGAIQEIVVKGFDIAAARARFVSGATVRGDGQVGLILDVPSILAAPRHKGLLAGR